MTGILTLVRHGESEYNQLNLFAGWVNCQLTDKGKHQAKLVGMQFSRENYVPNLVFSSTLIRAIETAKLICERLDTIPPIICKTELVERHYGNLTGIDKSEAVQLFGVEKVLEYRRSFDIAPPPITEDNFHFNELGVQRQWLPPVTLSESLKDVIERITPFWNNELKPELMKNNDILVVAHGNSLRALYMLANDLTPKEIIGFEFENATPIRIHINN